MRGVRRGSLERPGSDPGRRGPGARALERARAILAGDPLRAGAGPSLLAALKRSAAAVAGADILDLENLLATGGEAASFVAAPLYPSGCSVGGGVARIRREGPHSRERVVEHNRHFLRAVVDITSEGSAAGYDSHGISLVLLDLPTGQVEVVGAKTSGDIDERGFITVSQLLRKVPGLEQGTSLVLVAGAQTRAATQGDNMYSSANAHLHVERMTREVLSEALAPGELEKVRAVYPLRVGCDGPFHVGHNGDVNSKIRWERYFLEKGFQNDADSDSKEIPRIQRLVYECLAADRILGGERCLQWLIHDLAERHVLSEHAVTDERGRVVERTLAEQQQAVLELSRTLAASGASQVTVAGALAARLISFVDPTSVYVYETLTSLRDRDDSPLPVATLVRGPKAGGMVLYEDPRDAAMPIKFASNLANLRAQIQQYDGERQEQVPVDYITTGARVHIREGEVSYHALSDWQIAELTADPDRPTEPALRFYDLLDGGRLPPRPVRSPIIDYRLRGQERAASLKATGEFAQASRVDRAVVYDTVLGEIVSGPTAVLRKQIKAFATEAPASYAVDNQYGAEILLSFVTLLRNTRQLFEGSFDSQGRLQSEVSLRPEALFRLEEGHLSLAELQQLLGRVEAVVGLGEGTSRNVLGMAFSAAQLEGLSALHTVAMESNLARMQAPRMTHETLLAFVSNSGGTKPVVALAEETLERLGQDWRSGPFVWAVTNLVTSELARLAARSLGASVTNLPWEKAVGSTFAAFTALQNLLAMLVYVHESRGVLKPGRARHLYRALASFPAVARSVLAFPAAREEVRRLARLIAGNNLDIAYVGALEGYDAAEGALKFAEMMQHSRVKFYSGAYEQHGQRATYLRALRTHPGTLVILHVPNLETTIGSWSAQLIREDRPRCGKIAVICAQEDALTLRESGADFVIPAPEGTTETVFTDLLGKLLIDNMLTEATIEESNAIAGKLAGWGHRLLDLAAGASPVRQDVLKRELGRMRREFHRMDGAGIDARARQEAMLDLERQVAAGAVTFAEREEKLTELCRGGRCVTVTSAESRQRVNDLLDVLTQTDLGGEPEVFEGLLWDFVLELSDRGLAMRVADERFGHDAERARTAVHYQGLAKIIGANPIKPDNIAKFQQGWGIASFLLPPGRRRSHCSAVLERALLAEDGSWRLAKKELARLGLRAADQARLEAFGLVCRVERWSAASPEYLGQGLFSFSAASGGEEAAQGAPLETVLRERRPAIALTLRNGGLVLSVLSVDAFGDPEQLVTMESSILALSEVERAAAVRQSPFLSQRGSQVAGWLAAVAPAVRRRVLSRVGLAEQVALEEDALRARVRELAARAALLDQLGHPDALAHCGLDLLDVTAQNLETLRNVLIAVRSFRGSAVYRVRVSSEAGREELTAIREPATLRGIADEGRSSFDEWNRLKGNKKIAAAGRRLKMGYGKDSAPVIIVPAEDGHGRVDRLLLIHPEIDEELPVEDRIRTLGGKYQLIVNHSSEYVEWNDAYLGQVRMADLMMLSDEEIADGLIVPHARVSSRASAR